jgi:hypothetical protein
MAKSVLTGVHTQTLRDVFYLFSSTPASTRHSLYLTWAKKTLCAKGVQEKASQSEFKTLLVHEALQKMLQLKKSY